VSALSKRAMIVTLNVSCWTARKQDKKVSAEVEASHNAKDAGRYNKLLIDKVHLDPLTNWAGQIRSAHYHMTLPWMDNGGRLLPAKLFMDYRNKIDDMRSEYESRVRMLIAKYPQLVQDARMRLGTMYQPDDYPLVGELGSKFSVDLDIMPVPDCSDFRVDISDKEAERIREDMASKVRARQEAAMKDAWDRVRDVVSTIHLRVSADKPVIRDSLMGNARELVALLPGLNVNDDPLLAKVTDEISNNLLESTWNLRNSKASRLHLAEKAEKVLAMLP
jgi:hypothetical protein